MAIKTRNYSVVVGERAVSPLAQAQLEDCLYVFTFCEPPAPLGSGALVDFTGLASAKMTIRDTANRLIVARDYSATTGAGNLSFQILQSDLSAEPTQMASVDVEWTNADDYTEQLLVAEPFQILRSVAQPGDGPTPAPPPGAVMADSPIAAGALIKASTTTEGAYSTLLASDSALLMVGVAVTAAASTGSLFSAQFVPGTVTRMISDGTGTIAEGGAVQPSTTIDGAVRAGFTNLCGYNVGAAVPATLGASVSVL